MHIIRGIIELFSPGLKCKRVGHDMQKHHRSGYYPDGGFRSVVTNVVQSGRECSRCGHAEDWVTIHEWGMQSFSAPVELMQEIRNSDSKNPCWVEFW